MQTEEIDIILKYNQEGILCGYDAETGEMIGKVFSSGEATEE